MQVLVTGGAGFIGFHTAKALIERGDSVVIVDNFNDYYDVKLKEARVKMLDAKVIRADISLYKSMEKVFRQGFDKVCHLAAQAGVRHSLKDPFAYQKSNALGTLNMLELCRTNNVKDFVFASSSSVYGTGKMPFTETDKLDSPLSLYAATKKYNELQAYVYHNLYGLNCTGLRFFTVYGEYGRPDMALFSFTKAILAGEVINVFNQGNMLRDFTHVSDIVKGVVSAIDHSYPYEIFNLARGEQVLLKDFIHEIEKSLGMKAEKKFLPMQKGDLPGTSADITKAQRMLGYAPKVSIQKGIRRFVEWYKDYYSGSSLHLAEDF